MPHSPTLFNRLFYRPTLELTWQWWRRVYGPALGSLAPVESRFRRWVLPQLGEIALGQIRPSDVELLLQRCDRHPQTQNHVLADLRRVCRAAVAEGMIPADPTESVKHRRVPLVDRPILTPEIGGRLLQVSPQPLRSMFALALYAGLRKGEILGLLLEDVDLEKQLLHVRRSHGRDCTKNGRWRTLPIADELAELLRKWDRRLEAPTSPGRAAVLLFPGGSAGGRYHSTLRLSVRLRVYLRQAGYLIARAPQLGGIRFHDLRHSCASQLAELGMREEDVGWLLGHNPSVTGRYTHGRIDRVRQCLSRMHWR